MAVQTTYNATQAAAVAGAPATMQPAIDISRNVENAEGIGFGVAVGQGTTPKGVVPFSSTANKFVGITLLDRSAAGTAGNPDSFPQRASARIRRKGDVWVVAAVAVAAGDPVYLTSAGAFTNVSTSNTLVAGARFDTSTSANGQLAVVYLG